MLVYRALIEKIASSRQHGMMKPERWDLTASASRHVRTSQRSTMGSQGSSVRVPPTACDFAVSNATGER
jgi:hypothetical protein